MSLAIYKFPKVVEAPFPLVSKGIPHPTWYGFKPFFSVDWQIILSGSLARCPLTQAISIGCSIIYGDTAMSLAFCKLQEVLKSDFPLV